MREIKFRAWNENRQDWEGSFSISDKGSFLRIGISQSTQGIHIMQFTGLLDKNGVEIYEGDVFKLERPGDIKRFYEVEYSNEVGAFYAGAYLLGDFLNNGNCEVIGNIYQNPELLK